MVITLWLSPLFAQCCYLGGGVPLWIWGSQGTMDSLHHCMSFYTVTILTPLPGAGYAAGSTVWFPSACQGPFPSHGLPISRWLLSSQLVSSHFTPGGWGPQLRKEPSAFLGRGGKHYFYKYLNINCVNIYLLNKCYKYIALAVCLVLF